MTTFGSGTLNVTLTSPNFSGMVTVQEQGGALASDPMSVSVPVDGGADYTIVVAGADSSSRGDYQIAVSFTPADGETCLSQGSLAAAKSVHGSISDASCSDSSGLMFQYYDLPIAAPGLADLRVQPSGDIATVVTILDQNGRLVSQDMESGGFEQPILRQQLPAGQYIGAGRLSGLDGRLYAAIPIHIQGSPENLPPADTLFSTPKTGNRRQRGSCQSDRLGCRIPISFRPPAPGTLEHRSIVRRFRRCRS